MTLLISPASGLGPLHGSWPSVLGRHQRFILSSTRCSKIHVQTPSLRPYSLQGISQLESGFATLTCTFHFKRERTTFLKVFLEALISFKLTIEHDYVSLVLSIDGLKHSLLSGLTVASDARNGDIQLSKQQFLLLRPKIISSSQRPHSSMLISH